MYYGRLVNGAGLVGTFIIAVHAFGRPSYDVIEGETLIATFATNVKGASRIPSTKILGNITVIADTARMLICSF